MQDMKIGIIKMAFFMKSQLLFFGAGIHNWYREVQYECDSEQNHNEANHICVQDAFASVAP